ncbi:hypothetical protein [uncultured Methanobrevibacter sp.]|uniref:hypothetical protein n=1 Tax=uncultured Methanobrevibacter sp. TaxID=253161 RepID=UPI0025D838A6|nr:hypothetical protein [uncultured Methanobrevibacter sp.]
MHVKDVLDNLNINVDMPQHWYSTEVDNIFEKGEIVKNDSIIKIKAKDNNNTKYIIIDPDESMSIVSQLKNGNFIGVKYLNNKDDFEYIGKITDLKYKTNLI